MTKELLRELGSCGDYISTFIRRFPVSEFPEGVEITEENCVANSGHFSWSWASEVMLNNDGYRRFSVVLTELRTARDAVLEQYNQARRAWTRQYDEPYSSPHDGTPDEARAAYNALTEVHRQRMAEANFSDDSYELEARAFGRVFDTEPEMRSPKVTRAQEAAVERVERDAIAAHESVVALLESTRTQLAQLNEQLPGLVEKELELRTTVAPARARRAAAHAALLADRAEEARRNAERLVAEHTTAQAEADRLAAEAAESTGTTSGADDANETTSDTVSTNA